MVTTNSNVNEPQKRTPEQLANRKHTLSFCKTDGVPVDIDLSDDRQFNFLLDERGGEEYLKTYFPHYHRTLHASRARAVAAKSGNGPAVQTHRTLLEKAADGEDVSSTWSDLIQIAGFTAQQVSSSQVATNQEQSQTAYMVQATALISFVAGMETMSATLTIGNPNTGELIGQRTVTPVFDQGYDSAITAAGTTQDINGIEATITVDGLPYSSATPLHKVATTTLTDQVDPSSPVTVINPVHKATQPNTGFIKVCMGRSASDCDYLYNYQPAGIDPTPTIQVSGKVSYAGTITQPSPDSSKFGLYFFVKNRNGGAAQLFAGANPYNYFSLSPDGHTLSWDFAPALFNTAPWNQGDLIDLNMTVEICVNSIVTNTQFQMTSLSAVQPNASIAKIDVLKFVWGCLGANSLVNMKDGMKRRIDSLSVGDEVVINQHGTCASVVDVVTGREDKACLRITTESGRSLLVTDGHPISKYDGFCLAKDLLPGELIVTESGFESVADISQEAYDGIVYNLKLDGHVYDTAHFANGILVGDANMQGYLLDEHIKKARKARTLDELPVEWRFDAENTARLEEGKMVIPVTHMNESWGVSPR